MFSKIGVRSFLINLSAAISELAGSMDAEDNAPTPAAPEINEGANESLATKEKKTRKPRTTKPKEEPAEEMEEVESKFTETPADDETEETEEDEDDFAGMPEEETEKEATVEDLRAALVAYAQVNGKPKAYEVLAKFDKATKANQVKPANLAKAIKALEIKKKK